MSTGADALPPSSATASQPLPERVGRYQIQERLGAGGMGTVYKAHDPELDRTVALKLPRFDGPAEGRSIRIQRFHREARAAARLWHPHVCPIYDIGEHNGRPFVVMAYVPGRSLAEVLKQQGRFEDVWQAVAITRQVLDAIGAVHACGLIHRDLKPGNILLDSSGRPVLTDFGLARVENDTEHLTSDGVVLGTPAFMAPEQAAGEAARIGPWTDVYGVGVLLYQMVTGRLPFEGPPLTVLSRIVHESPPSPRTWRPDLDPALEAVLLKALAKEPTERYPTASELAAALSQLSMGAAVTAELPVPPGQFPLTERVRIGVGPEKGTTPGSPPGGMTAQQRWLLRAMIFLSGIAFALLLATLPWSCHGVVATKWIGGMATAKGMPPVMVKLPPDPSLSPAMIQAVEKSQRVKLTELLKRGGDPNARAADGETLLMKAAAHNDIPILTLLLNNGADPNIRYENGETLVMKAIARNDLPTVKVFIDHGADPNVRDANQETALMKAAAHADLVLLTALLAQSTLQTNMKDKKGETALMKAAAAGHAEIVERLLLTQRQPLQKTTIDGVQVVAPEVEVNEEDNKGETALIKAKGHPQIVEMLKRAGAR
jgi:tRNA A-37 threonylcarbamoyl transferase component Bud32